MNETAVEIRRLRDCLSGLMSLLALPSLWDSRDPTEVLRTVLEMLARMLDLDLAYARLDEGALVPALELARSEHLPDIARRADEVGAVIEPWLLAQHPGVPYAVPNPFQQGELRVTHLWLGVRKEVGVVLAASRRPGFPSSTETLLLRVAVNQALVELQRAQLAAVRQRAETAEQLNDEITAHNAYLRQETEQHWGEIVGRSKVLREALTLVERVAPTNACVLVQGETGTGKELIARAIHRLSHRRQHPFVRLNCAAIPTGLIEAELFGHEKGAFTGAIGKRIGRFELADKGTIFLDEVGEIPLELQAKLLRVLQEHEFERLGSTHTQKSDVRLIAASNRDLAQMVADRTFRDDLYYRLKVFPIEIPPLRRRVDDIPMLAQHFLQAHALANNRPITTMAPEGLAALVRYSWPGNVRELSNFIERCVILTQGATLEVPVGELKPRPSDQDATGESLEHMERLHILRVLDECNGVISGPAGAAAKLGMKRTSLQYRMQKLGIGRS
ncbi:sigma 54-interacting transcriptional regulator [Variovorax ginsengisoli]|uniref:Sigma 54-interacting transcriptional regulator n=1 Tax=Variovorax ginsengisoli TaxID=363844 RepID=A0ABT8SE88_9BURK|nr:sigma 54-interacting transcriptional regulator [Variovorax ginsengisoli]MDN8618071.1 sigma 54-interacting transcriptional regulator [Variovorax ginsengisoli]MDO1537241.1 sigma 54-interacting transcriptional regulator [Variovorax ginsengisoli]